jgi:molybdopterin synthase sulfur carrier subunit
MLLVSCANSGSEMKVKVRLFTTLAVHVPDVEPGVTFEVELPIGSDLSHLIAHLHLPETETKITLVNGRAQPMDYRLRDNEEVAIFPPIGGG